MRILLSLALLAASAASAQVDPEAVWPRQVGNVWMFTDAVEPGVVVRWEITGEVEGDVVVEGQPVRRTLALLAENGNEPCAIRDEVDGTAVVFTLVQPDDFEAPCLAPRFFPGQFHTVGRGTEPMRVGEWGEARSVAIGDDEVEGRTAGGWADAGPPDVYYEDLYGLLEGVGLYELWRAHHASGGTNETLVAYELAYASVNGVVYGAPVANEEGPEGSPRLTAAPNPARGVIRLSGPNASPVSLEVLDVQGRVVHRVARTALPASVVVRGLAPGVYTVVASDGETRRRARVVVVR